MNVQKKRVAYLDILRVIAIFTVFFIHTGDAGIHYYLNASSQAGYWIGTFMATASQHCVPLFFMITGALLLKKEESIGYVLRHRVLRMAVVIVLTMGFMYCLRVLGGGQAGLYDFFYLLYSGTGWPQQWFLYTYISVLLILPFLQKLVRAIPGKAWFHYLFILYLFLNGALPIVEYFMQWTRTPLEIPMFGPYVVCAMAGYYVEQLSGDTFMKARNILLLNVAAFALLLLETCLNHTALLRDGSIMAFGGEFALVTAMTLFVDVRYLCTRSQIPAMAQKVISFMGAGTFGCYLIDEQLRGVCRPIFDALLPGIGTYPAVFVWIACSLVLGMILSNIVKKIPFFGKLI
ncbi:MAG: acyltransferase family protein [Eubacterium sp.]|nr:acyltransferase family protein [Eubacterium sp.]MCM1215782.1 acyltransferase family protein [Lachnospiraceae bacterium]MCM1304132.1 acyltransferase family protein [Butyrivibrio sp.]MCM1344090.1 acyltransferase family protein [Muribaculaceae bacterium]MCM1238345.1 acyltransferase family protein [Lachnospiraceae bacterium]